MGITVEEVRRIASLARLELRPDEEQRLAGQLGKILDHVDRLREVDTESVEPDASEAAGERALRPDRPVPGLDPASALANAPDAAADHFRVPRILG